jgi:hypothetical protein
MVSVNGSLFAFGGIAVDPTSPPDEFLTSDITAPASFTKQHIIAVSENL